jgi:hypothetical protein
MNGPKKPSHDLPPGTPGSKPIPRRLRKKKKHAKGIWLPEDSGGEPRPRR